MPSCDTEVTQRWGSALKVNDRSPGSNGSSEQTSLLLWPGRCCELRNAGRGAMCSLSHLSRALNWTCIRCVQVVAETWGCSAAKPCKEVRATYRTVFMFTLQTVSRRAGFFKIPACFLITLQTDEHCVRITQLERVCMCVFSYSFLCRPPELSNPNEVKDGPTALEVLRFLFLFFLKHPLSFSKLHITHFLQFFRKQ